MSPVLYIVIPCYNEEAVLPLTSGMFLKKIKDLAAAGKISDKSRILFVNDGSKDVAKKYGGDVIISEKNNEFTVTVILDRKNL